MFDKIQYGPLADEQILLRHTFYKELLSDIDFEIRMMCLVDPIIPESFYECRNAVLEKYSAYRVEGEKRRLIEPRLSKWDRRGKGLDVKRLKIVEGAIEFNKKLK